MKTRVVVGLVLTVLLIAMLALGGYFLLTVIALVSFAAVFEVGRVVKNKEMEPVLLPAYLFALAFPFIYDLFGLVYLAAAYLLTLLATITTTFFLPKRSVENGIVSVYILAYPVLLLICMMLVYFKFDRTVGLTAAALAYAAPACSDTFAYFGGTWFGKKKLCPHISPKKTVEGAYFAVLGGVVFGALLIPLQTVWAGTTPAWLLLVTGLLCGIFAQVGDLYASTLKRWTEVKDFSSVFPGHGGIMDRIDSILICSPIVLSLFTILAETGIY